MGLRLISFLSLGLLAINFGPLHAQDLPSATVAVLDLQLVIRECAAAKDVRRQLQVYRNKYQQEIATTEAVLRKEERELKGQQALLTPKVFDEKRQDFERKVIQVQRRVQDRSRALDRAFNVAMNQIQKTIVPIVKDLTMKRNFNIVVDRSRVLFAKSSLDITDIVLKTLNERLTSVMVPEPVK